MDNAKKLNEKATKTQKDATQNISEIFADPFPIKPSMILRMKPNERKQNRELIRETFRRR